MHDLVWTESEKKTARQAFEAAQTAELAETLADFKARAAAVVEPHQMWEIQEHLARRQREINEKYDYRYSQLIYVFARLLGEGRLQESQLAGLDDRKLAAIRFLGTPAR